MDFEMQAGQSLDAAAAARARDAAQPKDGAASISEPADTQEKKENAGPKVPPIPSSALVILPPEKRRFDAKAEATSTVGGAEKGKWRRRISQAAVIVILCGAAFAAGGHFLGSTPLADHAANPTPASWQAAKDDSGTADMRSTTMALSNEVHGIEARVNSLAATNGTSEEIRALKKSIDGLKASLESQKAEADASIAQLSARFDQLQREPARLTRASLEKGEHGESSAAIERTVDPKAIQATLDRAAREKSDPITTASIPAGPQSAETTLPRAQPLPTAAAEPPKKPLLLRNWVVRDVYDGIALVEGPEGAFEVMPGDTIPGAGTVRSIERRAGGWIVVTSRGLVDYARD
jgi:hypothetical protein